MDVTSSEMLKVLNVRKEVKEKLASYRYAVNQPKVNMETVVAEYDKMASVYDEVSERLFFSFFFGVVTDRISFGSFFALSSAFEAVFV